MRIQRLREEALKAQEEERLEIERLEREALREQRRIEDELAAIKREERIAAQAEEQARRRKK